MNELLVSGSESASPVIAGNSRQTEGDGAAFADLLDGAIGSGQEDAVQAARVSNDPQDAAQDAARNASVEQDAAVQGGGMPMRRELTPEEEQRLQWLQDQLQQCLMSLAERPSEQTRQRIRELEKEISELTGVDMKSSLSKGARNLTELDPDAEDEDERRGKKMSGEMAKELGANPLPVDRVETGVDKGTPNIMNFYQQNLAAFLAVGVGGNLKA